MMDTSESRRIHPSEPDLPPAGAGWPRPRGPRTGVSLVAFLAVGVSGIFVNGLLLVAFTEAVGLHYLISAILATQGSSLWNFALHYALIFQHRGRRRSLASQLGRYLLMNNAALLLRAPLLGILVAELGVHYVVANLLTLISLALLRFLISDRWIWPQSEEPSAAADRHAYDIHGILGVKSEVALPELAYFRVSALSREADIEIRRGHPVAAELSDPWIEYGEGLGRLGFHIVVMRSRGFRVWASPLVQRSPHVLYTNVVEPLLRWSLVARGYALVHAACIAFDGQAVLVTAPTDTGKTTTILRALKSQSWSFLSDDMTILAPEGGILSFPKPLTISAHTLHAVSSATFGFGERISLALQSRLHSRGGRRFGLWLAEIGLPAASLNAIVQLLIPPPKYPVERLVPGVSISDRAVLQHVVLLQRGAEGETSLPPSMITSALESNAEDAYGFPPYRAIESFLRRHGEEDLHDAEYRIIVQATGDCAGTCLASPQFGWWERLPRVVRSRGGRSPEPITRPRALRHEVEQRS